MENNWYNFSGEEVLRRLNTKREGLSEKEAEKRLKIYGPNKIIKKRTFSALKIFLSQFTNFLIIILILAALIAALTGKIVEALAVAFVVLLNTFLGFFMEHRAEKSIAALKKMLLPVARVIRDGKEKIIETQFLVPGDIIVLEEGNKIPADCRLLETVSLEVNEASLTGESMPVAKTTDANPVRKGGALNPTFSKNKDRDLYSFLPQGMGLSNGVKVQEDEKRQMVFMGTIIAKGHGKAVVVKTGMETEFGKIAGMLTEVKEVPSPLQKQTVILGKKIAIIAFSIAIFILIIGILQGKPLFDYKQLMIALSLFVAVIPEGLPVVLTLALALGVHWMARQKAIMRRMTAVETLGCTQVICTDKTGTLTKNEMVVRKIWLGGKEFEVGEKKFDFKISPEIPIFLKIGILCNMAEVYPKGEGFEILGDPTEASLLVLGEKAGIKEKKAKAKGKFLNEFPFDQSLKRRAVVWEEQGKIELLTMGAPETILEISSKFLKGEQEIDLSLESRQEIVKAYQSLAAQGYRMLGLAYKKLAYQKEYLREEIEKSLVFTGLAAIYDAPRPEVAEAIKICITAGIRVVMITGDNELTALAIAKEIGLVQKKEKVVTGRGLDQMSDQELLVIIDKINIFARATPTHKLKIVAALQKKNNVVAVTGDGVNDAPALKEADIGVAMGITGTDVAKEASDMIITDDNFASIVTATKEGRTIFDNIKKFVQFLLTANAIETPLIIVAMFLGWPLPLNPLHILWINLVTDSTPAVTLSIEPSSRGIMERKPRPPKETIFKGIVPFILIAAVFGFLIALAIFSWVYFQNPGSEESLGQARTMAFTFIVIFKLFLVFSCRSFKENIFQLGLLTNKKMILAVGFSLSLQLMIIYNPLMQGIFQTTPLSIADWLIILPLASLGFILMEIKKTIYAKIFHH